MQTVRVDWERTDNVEVNGDGRRAETVGSVARVAAGVRQLDTGDVQPRAASLGVEPLPAEVHRARVLRPGDERPRGAVHWTRDANWRSELYDQRRRILFLHLRRMRSCTHDNTAIDTRDDENHQRRDEI